MLLSDMSTELFWSKNLENYTCTIDITTQRKYMNYDIQTCGGESGHSNYEGWSFYATSIAIKVAKLWVFMSKITACIYIHL